MESFKQSVTEIFKFEWLGEAWESVVGTPLEIKLLVLGLIVASIIVLVLMRTSSKNISKKWTTREIAVGALSIAIAFVLSYIRFWKMPQGGSITLASMLPIMIFAYVYGLRKGLIVGLAYGLLQVIQDPYIVHWAQAILDYGVAFMALALAGLFRKKVSPSTFLLGMLIAGIVRFMAHLFSGVIFFGQYAPEGTNVWAYSAAYNSFVFVDLAICILIGMLVALTRIVKPLKLMENR